jgi:uncharacterized membrane protein
MTSSALSTVGRLFFAIPIFAFGIQYLHYGHYLGGLPPVPPWAQGGSIGAYVIGAILLAAGISMAANWNARASSFFIGIIFLLCVLFFHTLHLHEIIFDGTSRTRVLEVMSLGAAALVLAALSPSVSFFSRGTNAAIEKFSRFAVLLFAFTLVIYGLQHFQFAKFIAFLIPAWMPLRLFLAYFTGVALIAAGLSMAIKVLGKLSSLMLALMFFLWVVTLHAPRVATKLTNGDEWSSLFVALAMCGASLLISRTFFTRTVL